MESGSKFKTQHQKMTKGKKKNQENRLRQSMKLSKPFEQSEQEMNVEGQTMISNFKHGFQRKGFRKNKESRWLLTISLPSFYHDLNDPNLQKASNQFAKILDNLFRDPKIRLEHALRFDSGCIRDVRDFKFKTVIELGPTTHRLHAHSYIHIQHSANLKLKYMSIGKYIAKEMDIESKKVWVHGDLIKEASFDFQEALVLDYIQKHMTELAGNNSPIPKNGNMIINRNQQQIIKTKDSDEESDSSFEMIDEPGDSDSESNSESDSETESEEEDASEEEISDDKPSIGKLDRIRSLDLQMPSWINN